MLKTAAKQDAIEAVICHFSQNSAEYGALASNRRNDPAAVHRIGSPSPLAPWLEHKQRTLIGAPASRRRRMAKVHRPRPMQLSGAWPDRAQAHRRQGSIGRPYPVDGRHFHAGPAPSEILHTGEALCLASDAETVLTARRTTILGREPRGRKAGHRRGGSSASTAWNARPR